MDKNFLLIGGDLRLFYAAKKLAGLYKTGKDTGEIAAFGFDSERKADGVTMLEKLGGKRFDRIILPLPASTDGEYITAPYHEGKIHYSVLEDVAAEGATVFVGRRFDKLEQLCERLNLKLVDYFEREELVVMNAMVTAEGAIQIALEESAITLYGAKILLTGYGRITKALVRQLSGFGADVTVTARSFSDLAWARIMGARAIHLPAVNSILPTVDIVINTVPATIFSEERLRLLKDDCLFIDLASKKGVEDFELAKNLGIRTIWALSLPGKVAPVTAGGIIADTIHNILSEEAENANH